MDQIVGPSWLDEDCFDIFAKVPEGATSEQMPAMFQALLAERFKLAAHKEDRPSNVYALVVDKGGPKFKESDPSSNFMGVPRRHEGAPARRTWGRGVHDHGGACQLSFGPGLRSGAGLYRSQRKIRHRPLLGAGSGLRTVGRIHWSFRRRTPKSDLPPAPTADLFTAVRESLGLRLEPRKAPVEVLVIDHIERVPTAN